MSQRIPRRRPDIYQERRRRYRLRCFYDIFALFFDALELHRSIEQKYESGVQKLCEHYGLLRTELIQKISYQEISELFEFEELVRLRTHYLLPFLEISGSTLAAESRMTAKGFLLHVKHLYHLVSMLSLEELNVVEIAPGYSDLAESENLWEILGEVDREFPTKLREIRSKFEQAQEEIEKILGFYAQERITLRSLYLFERSRMAVHYGDVDRFYLFIEPTGLFGAYVTVAESFLDGQFVGDAVEVIQELEREIEARGVGTLLSREGGEAVLDRYDTLRGLLHIGPGPSSPEPVVVGP